MSQREAKTTIEQFATENWPSLPKRKLASIPNIHVQVLCYVSFREGTSKPWGEIMESDEDIIVYNQTATVCACCVSQN